MKNNLVCFCKEVSETEIINVIRKKHIHSVDDVVLVSGASTGCGRCRDQVEKLFRKYKSDVTDQQLRLF